MPIFDTHIKSLDGESCEEVEFTGSKLADFTTVRRPDMNQLKLKYSHTQDKRFYMTSTGEHQIQLNLGHGIYSKIETERDYSKGTRESRWYRRQLPVGWCMRETNMRVETAACT